MDSNTSHTKSTLKSTLWAMLGAAALAGTTLTLTGCNTVEGVGRDVEAAGDSVADTARDAKD